MVGQESVGVNRLGDNPRKPKKSTAIRIDNTCLSTIASNPIASYS